MGKLSFDTTFLIDFQRERREGEGPAHEFLRINKTEVACLSVIAFAEYAEAFDDLTAPAFLSMAEAFELITIDRAIALRYSHITRQLRSQGRLIGSNDLWIAATALEKQLPLVTANIRDFQRIPDLNLIAYR